MKNLKLLSTILLSLMLILTISTAVFADNETDDDIWSDVDVVDDDNNTVENPAEDTADNTANDLENESLFENIEVENEVENEVEEEEEYNNLYTTQNSTTANSENLADTGIRDSSIIALIVIISSVVAIYSAKKFNEYKNV